MALSFPCPSCSKTLRVSRQHAGKRGRCPGCQQSLTVPQIPGVEDSHDLEPIELDDSRELFNTLVGQGAQAAWDPASEEERLRLERERLELERARLELERRTLESSARLRATEPARKTPSTRLKAVEPARKKAESKSRLGAVRPFSRLPESTQEGASPRDPASNALVVGVAILGAGALIALAVVVTAKPTPPPGPTVNSPSDQRAEKPDRVTREPPATPVRAPAVAVAPAKLTPSEIEALIVEAKSLIEAGKPAEGDSILTRVIAADAANADAYSIRSWARSIRGDYGSALSDANAALKLVPGFWGAWINRGIALQHLGQLDAALEAFSSAVQIQPRLALGYLDRAEVYRAQRLWREAIGDYGKVLELDPQSAQARFWRGHCNVMIDQLAEAEADYTVALGLLRPTDSNRSMVERNLEAVRQAIRARQSGAAGSAPMLEEPEEEPEQPSGADVAKAETPPAKGDPKLPAKPAGKPPPPPEPPEPADRTGPEWPAKPTKSDFARLFQGWKKAPLESEYFQRLQEGFLRTPVDLKTLDLLAGMLGDKTKGESAAQILQVQVLTSQTGLTTPAEFSKKWKALRAEWKDQTRRAPISKDLLADAAREPGTWQLQGGNLRLGARYRLERLPPEAETKAFSILVRVWTPVNSTRAKIGLGSSQGAWEVEHKNGEWTTRAGTQVSFVAPALVGWNEILFDCALERGGNVRGARILTIKVNGKILLDRGELNGELNSFRVDPGEPGAVFAGADFRVR